MSLRVVLFSALVSGCAPSLPGAFFGELTQPGEGEGLLQRSVLREGGTLFLDGPLAEGVHIESSDPDVLHAMTALELAGEEPLKEEIDPDATLLPDFERGISGITLASGRPGLAELTLVDDLTGQTLDAIEIEVGQAARIEIVPGGPWGDLRQLVPRIFAGAEYSLLPLAYAQGGQPLLGLDSNLLKGDSFCKLPPSAPGVYELPCGTVSVAAPEEVLRIELVELEGALVAVGRDRDGQPVLGMPAQWTSAKDPDARGDLYALEEGDGELQASEVTVRLGELEATALVYQSGPGVVRQSDSYGCSTAGGASGLLPLLIAPLLLRRRAL